MDPIVKEIDRAFFHSDARASLIRDVCIEFMQAWWELSASVDLDRVAPASKMEGTREKLLSLGIEPEMHIGRDYQYFRGSPAAAAEFCAGQLLGQQIQDADSASLSEEYFKLDNVGSHTIDPRTEAACLKAGDPSYQTLIDKLVKRDVITNVSMLLDADLEVRGT